MTAIPLINDPWQTGVLDKAVHARLVAQKDKYAADAGIAPAFIWTPLAETCPTEEEQSWVVKLRTEQVLYLAVLQERLQPAIRQDCGSCNS